MCRRASREGAPELAGLARFRREGHSKSKGTRMGPREEEIDRTQTPPPCHSVPGLCWQIGEVGVGKVMWGQVRG